MLIMIKAKLHIGHQMSIHTIHICNVFSGKKKKFCNFKKVYRKLIEISLYGNLTLIISYLPYPTI